MKPTKSGKRESDWAYHAWLEAKNHKAYEGSFADWQSLLRHFARPQRHRLCERNTAGFIDIRINP